jgi:hypothetical protein
MTIRMRAKNRTGVTRRAALQFGWGAVAAACAPAWAFAAKEFWNERKPEEWTEEERQELLTKSPWAKEASTSFFGGPNVAGGRTATTNRGRRTVGTSTGGGPAPDPGKMRSIVRWESALPIREANHNESKDDPAANYILNVSGDLPMLGPASDDETEDEFAHRMEPLKQFTKLEKRGDPIYLSQVRYKGTRGSEGALFYFVRNDLITLSDHTVTFVTKLGPIDVKAKFSTHEMIYQGKLEL